MKGSAVMSEQTSKSGMSKTGALSAVGFMAGLSVISFLIVLVNYQVDSFEFWVFTSMCFVAAAGQAIGIFFISKDWDSDTPSERDEMTRGAVFIPPLVAVFSIVAIGVGLVALVIWMFTAGGGSSGSGGSSTSPSYREVKDRYGNRTGWINTQTGEIKDRYGNRTGSINTQTGEIKDRYGNQTGWIK